MPADAESPTIPLPTEPAPSRPALELWLIRHGETEWNRERRIQGQQPNPLSELGVMQARQLGARLACEHFDAVYASDLKRAVQTVELALPGHEPVYDVRLREIARGVLEGQLGANLVGEQRDLYATMQRDLLNVRPPGGENYRDVGVRAVAWLESLPASGKIAAVTHGGVIFALLHHVVGVEGGTNWRFSAGNTGLTRLKFVGDEVRILGVNDLAHLEPRLDLRAY